METKIYGHRGSAGTHPENTMISFQEAYRVGADGIELDVQMTKDHELVIIHDETVNRTTNGKGWVKDLTLAQIKKLDASGKFKGKYGFCEIPTLEEVFKWATSNRLFINVELKNGLIPYRNIEEKTLDLIKKYRLQDRVILSSFNHYSMVKFRELNPHIEIALLYMEGIYKPWQYAKTLRANGIHPYHPTVKKELVKEAVKQGIAVRPFTINNEKLMKKFISFNCTAIITDFPEKAKKLIKK